MKLLLRVDCLHCAPCWPRCCLLTHSCTPVQTHTKTPNDCVVVTFRVTLLTLVPLIMLPPFMRPACQDMWLVCERWSTLEQMQVLDPSPSLLPQSDFIKWVGSHGIHMAVMSLKVNAATIDGVTPLYNCCVSGSDGCLELLLHHRALVLAPVAHKHFPSALHEACRRGEETIKQLSFNCTALNGDQRR